MDKKRSAREQKAARAAQDFLTALGVDTAVRGMEATPMRVAKLYATLFDGLGTDPNTLWGEVFETCARGLVAVRHIPFCSMCEHHLVPFFGVVSIAYLPGRGRVAGFSKFAEVVTCLSHRPQLQERLTAEIAEAVHTGLGAHGVLVVCEAEQLCMMLRSTHARGTRTVTSEMRGDEPLDSFAAQAWQMLGGAKKA